MDNVLLLSYQQLGLVRDPEETLPEHLKIIDALLLPMPGFTSIGLIEFALILVGQ